MESRTYQIVFTGKLTKGRLPREILTALCRLLKSDPGKIRSLFKGQGSVIGKSASRQTALQYAAAITGAGAICEVRDNPAHPAPMETTVAIAKKPLRPTIIDPAGGKTDFSRAPLPCARLGGDSTELHTNRPELKNIPFDRLGLISIFRSSPDRDAIELLLFIHNSRRPLMVRSSAISFTDFEGVVDHNLHSTLRNFLFMLLRKRPELRFDRDTDRFLRGQPAPMFTGDAAALASALGRALADHPRDASEREPPPDRPRQKSETPYRWMNPRK